MGMASSISSSRWLYDTICLEPDEDYYRGDSQTVFPVTPPYRSIRERVNSGELA